MTNSSFPPIPATEDRSAKWSVGHTGENAADIKTHAGADDDLIAFLDTLDDRRLMRLRQQA